MDFNKKEYAFFGDSFVKLFGLIRHPKLQTKGYKGGSAKGLSRSEQGNDNALDIRRRLRRMPSLKACYFGFGQVDVHLSYYFKTYGKKETIDLDEIARKYVEFVAHLNTTADKTIMGVYPSAPEDEFAGKTLVVYGSLSEEEAEEVPQCDLALQARQDCVVRFNQVLQETCEALHINFVNAFDDFCHYNVDDSSLDEQSPQQPPRLKDAYRDISQCNIHVVWETTLLLWMRRLPWLSTLAPKGFEQELQETFAKYVNTKPWAEGSQHVCQHVGIAAAVDMHSK